jgi:hypothetical protein
MSWIEQVERRASILIDQISTIKQIAIRNGGDPIALSAPYQRLLTSLYEDEAQLARTVDDSDLVAWLRGPAVDTETPRIMLVSSALIDLRTQITRMTKAILGMDEGARFKQSDFDLAMSGLAHGSLVVGIKVMHPSEISGTRHLWQEEEAKVYNSVRTVIRRLASISRHIGDDAVNDSIREDIKDPIERDSLLVATYHLAPSGRRGVDEVQLLQGGDNAEAAGRSLTRNDRVILKESITRPVRSQKHATLRGTVREVDLDAGRFEIRLQDAAGWRVRCSAPNMPIDMWKQILDGTIEIYGRTEYLGDMPRLVEVEEVKGFNPAPANGKLDLKSADR